MGTVSPVSNMSSSSSNEKKESSHVQQEPVQNVSNCCKKVKADNFASSDKIPPGDIFTPYSSLETASTFHDILQENYTTTGTVSYTHLDVYKRQISDM